MRGQRGQSTVLWLVLSFALLGCDVDTGKKQSASATTTAANDKPVDLLTARRRFHTKLIPNSFRADGPAPVPPDSIFRTVHYRSRAGDLVAYVSPDPGDGKKHPAVLWADGGFGGIGSSLWNPEFKKQGRGVRAFVDVGIVVMCPSWRGENDNPGKFELFFGEVDDLLDAASYLKQLPYVDPNRIYLAGHSTGGTLALLASVSPNDFRAVFSFGGAPDVLRVVANGRGYGNTPYDYRQEKESYYRSAIHFTDAIRTPTFYFEGEHSSYCEDALRMQYKAIQDGVPFHVAIIRSGNHFNILRSLKPLVAQKILDDTGPSCNISFPEISEDNRQGP